MVHSVLLRYAMFCAWNSSINSVIEQYSSFLVRNGVVRFEGVVARFTVIKQKKCEQAHIPHAPTLPDNALNDE